MSCASTRPITNPRRHGFSLVELLIAMTIALVFLSGIFMTYFQIMRTRDEAERRLDAMRNGRAAITTLSMELKALNRDYNPGIDDILLVARRDILDHGDRIDNDGDGTIDEEIVDGLDDDLTSGTVLTNDRHALLGTVRERPMYVGRTDLDDAGVDEDIKFGQSLMTFRIFPTTPSPSLISKTITYAIANYDGQANVLVRQTIIERAVGEPDVTVAPLAFGVLGFDVLYWNPNEAPANQYWVDRWDSSAADPAHPASSTPAALFPPLGLPAGIYVRLTLMADRHGDRAVANNQPVQTISMETIINIEQTIGDARYPRPSL
ncbi:prepilin-type N-terminal cleavage/methylation domain-containing protein [bacterium]|nr:prepilin-type N-terminal cleavage/methylation domain-containing protein [bacterium]